MDYVLGAATRSVSRSIAVVSEVAAGRRRSSVESRTSDGSDPDEDILSREQDLDDAIEDEKTDLKDEASLQADPNSGTDVADSFIRDHQTAMSVLPTLRPIPQPVILPQRRPKHRSRGFIRAYAPVLGECSGIDEAMFMSFLLDFDRAAKAWPIFDVINIAAFGLGMVPHEAFQAASTAMNVVAVAGEEVQTRYQTNRFMDKVNDSLFKPRKLYALIMTYRPDMPDDALLRADITDPQAVALSKALDRDTDNVVKRTISRFRNVSSGTTQHESLLPKPAPLIYPALDRALLEGRQNAAITSTDSHSAPSSTALQPVKSPSTNSILQDYLDRRAQAHFIASHPDSKLASALPPQEKKFVNRFADPDHPVNSGSVFGLVTGGTWDPIASGRIRRAEKKAMKKGEQPLTEKERHDAYMGRKVRGEATGTPSKSMLGLRNIFGSSMLYLVICNLPEATQ